MGISAVKGRQHPAVFLRVIMSNAVIDDTENKSFYFA
jgi:hypothetical protein